VRPLDLGVHAFLRSISDLPIADQSPWLLELVLAYEHERGTVARGPQTAEYGSGGRRRR
jgi:hypothetical protein